MPPKSPNAFSFDFDIKCNYLILLKYLYSIGAWHDTCDCNACSESKTEISTMPNKQASHSLKKEEEEDEMRTSTCLALIIACFALAPLSQAASEAPSFKKLDKDRDGFVSSDESNAAPIVLQTFSQLDRNTDGKLSKEEYAALEAAMSSGSGSSSPGASSAPPSSAAPPPSSATPPPSMDSGSGGGMARPPSP